MNFSPTTSCMSVALKLRRSDSISSELNYTEEDDDQNIGNLWRILDNIGRLRGRMSDHRLGQHALDYPAETDENAILPQTYIVLKIAFDIRESTLLWLVDKIRGKRRDGGAELVVLREPYDPDEGYVLHISISKIKLLEAAEEMEIIKRDKNGLMREFTVGQLEDFADEDQHVEDLFTVAERQTIVRHELENIRALAEDDHIPGYPTYTLFEGQSIFQVCLQYNIITKIYPLHDQEALKKLGRQWYMSLVKAQPFENIRLYFGESIALYFRFIGFYTTALLFPVVLGLLQLLVSLETLPFFCVFNVVWVTVFIETWNRHCSELAFEWGTIGMTSLDEPRANFRGTMQPDKITGKTLPQASRRVTNLKMYCVSFPVVLFCMWGAFSVMLASFWVEDYIKQEQEHPLAQFQAVPSICYTALVYLMNVYYRKLATFLTEWENHRTQSQYDRHRVTKLVLFEFVNNFMSLFYIAFVKQDMEMLRNQLATMLIILQAINNLQEAVVPLVIKCYMVKVGQLRNFLLRRQQQSNINSDGFSKQSSKTFISGPLKTIPEIHPEDERLEAAAKEGNLEDYEGTYDDYLELFIQFGYVVLFSSVYPMAAFWAVFNNVLEIRADAFKLCMVYKRPMIRRVKDIGAWKRAFQIMGAMSIMTNCGLLCLSPQMRRRAPTMSDIEWVLLFVLLEHFLLGIRYLLHIAIPDKPEWVRVALAKRNYESKQALKFERSQRSRRLLTRKFKTVHGDHHLDLH